MVGGKLWEMGYWVIIELVFEVEVINLGFILSNEIVNEILDKLSQLVWLEFCIIKIS
jgi:hypothetical protein